MAKKKTKPIEPPPRSEIETYHDPRDYWLNELASRFDKPSCFNGQVSIRRYRVHVYEIPESKEILVERLRHLWWNCDNHHHFKPLKHAAETLGIELSYDDFGKDRKKQ